MEVQEKEDLLSVGQIRLEPLQCFWYFQFASKKEMNGTIFFNSAIITVPAPLKQRQIHCLVLLAPQLNSGQR